MFWWWALVAGAEPLTLEQSLQEALTANAELQIGGLALEDSQAALLRARGGLDPQLSLGVDTAASNSPTNTQVDGQDVLQTSSSGWTASVTQPTPTGGAATLSVAERAFASNSQNVVSPRTVSDQVTLSVRQPLLSGVGALGPIRAARLTLSDAELARRAQVEQAILDVSGGYWRLVSAIRTLALAQGSVQVAQQSLTDTRERFDEGFAGTGDVFQVERAVGTASQALVVAEAELEAADAALKRLMGRDVADPVALEPTDVPAVLAEQPDLDTVLSLARSGNADWLRQQLGQQRAALGVRQARIAALPDLSVSGAVGVSGLGESAAEARSETGSGAFNDWSVGASLSVPLPARGLRADWTQARIAQQAARIALEAAEQDLYIRAQAAVRRVQRDRLRSELAAETVRVANLALQADQELLREGKGSTRDVVVSLEARDRATAAELQALIDLQGSQLDLKRVTGSLVGGVTLEPQ